VRSGHHCAQPLHRRLSIAASTRASVSVYTTADEIDTFLDAMTGVRKYFKL
ncbi:MAG: aminotransferase class V-fold PLP-dependent enzyme, partial [Microbacteriaceae bacterium]|nr:aminotransferase class V-fold PLP-dependent enzyme [Microbacteriaceae bacterium]